MDSFKLSFFIREISIAFMLVGKYDLHVYFPYKCVRYVLITV